MPGDSGHGIAPTAQHDDSDADRPRRSRRRLLTASGGVAATLLAGCSNVLPGGDDDAPKIEANRSDGTPTAEQTPPGPRGETHVTGLHYKTEGSTRTFHVTLSPPNSGADWWQVETLGGEKIGRKTFDEPRTGGRFTTKKAVEIDEGTTAIVLRGHSVQTGYGGQVMLADLEEGFITLEKQDTEPESFEGYTFDTGKNSSSES